MNSIRGEGLKDGEVEEEGVSTAHACSLGTLSTLDWIFAKDNKIFGYTSQ